jgi:hypothetical protein
MLKHAILLIVALHVAGCDKPKPPRPVAQAKAEPKPATIHKVPNGEIISAHVPGELWFETQKCYVHRDLEFKTSSISCPAGATGATNNIDYPD